MDHYMANSDSSPQGEMLDACISSLWGISPTLQASWHLFPNHVSQQNLVMQPGLQNLQSKHSFAQSLGAEMNQVVVYPSFKYELSNQQHPNEEASFFSSISGQMNILHRENTTLLQHENYMEGLFARFSSQGHLSTSTIQMNVSPDMQPLQSQRKSPPIEDGPRPSRQVGRAILNDEQARAIFQFKPNPLTKSRERASFLAHHYGISVKTVRDIWVGRTWYRATCGLDPSAPVSAERLQRRPGRPKGAKDSKPRARRRLRDDSDPDDAAAPGPTPFVQLEPSGLVRVSPSREPETRPDSRLDQDSTAHSAPTPPAAAARQQPPPSAPLSRPLPLGTGPASPPIRTHAVDDSDTGPGPRGSSHSPSDPGGSPGRLPSSKSTGDSDDRASESAPPLPPMRFRTSSSRDPGRIPTPARSGGTGPSESLHGRPLSWSSESLVPGPGPAIPPDPLDPFHDDSDWAYWPADPSQAHPSPLRLHADNYDDGLDVAGSAGLESGPKCGPAGPALRVDSAATARTWLGNLDD
jgi:hypothetical protein